MTPNRYGSGSVMAGIARPFTPARTAWGRVLLAVIVLFGGAARFWNLNWDLGRFTFDPDEAEYNRVAMGLGPDLNPHFFSYGSLPAYLYRGTAEVLGHLTGVDWLAVERFALIGRTYSALAGTLTIVVVYLAGRRVWGRGAGLLAATLIAGAALAIQSAHFGTVDADLSLLGALVLLVSLRIAGGGGARWYMLAGGLLGLALAVKLTAASFVILPLLAHGPRLWPMRHARGWWQQALGYPALLGGSLVAGCLAGAPYYLLAWPELRATLATLQTAASDPQKSSFLWQFIGTTPYGFELRNLVVWAVGVPVGIVLVAGYAWALAGAIRGPRLPLLLLTVWPALYFLYMGTFLGRFIRYLLPLIPFLCLCGAGGLWTLTGGLRRRGRWGAWAGRGLLAVAVGGAVGGGLSMLPIYTRLDTRIAASRWIYGHVPRGSQWLMESTYQQLPLPDAQHAPDWYQTSTIPVASATSPRTATVFANRLATNSWLEIPDRRWSAVLPRLPNFPVAGRFYALLFAGQLGYAEVARFASPPQLGPFVWSDDAAEETFQVFDHPTVRIFRNTGHLPAAELIRRLNTR